MIIVSNLTIGRLNAALYSVLSQSRLVGTAACMRLLLGTRQSTLQLSLLGSLSLLILCYIQVPDSVPVGKSWNGFGKPTDPEDGGTPEQYDPMGMVYAFLKILLSIVVGVIGQRALQDEEIKELPVLVLQASLFSGSVVALLPFTFAYAWLSGWEHGVLGGAPAVFRHCDAEWSEARCATIGRHASACCIRKTTGRNQ